MTTSRITAMSIAAVTAVLGATAYSSLTSSASATLSECPSGYLCVWSGTSYSGTVKKFSTVGQYTSIGLNGNQAVYNNRSKRSFLEQQRSGSDVSLCLAPGESRANLSGWQESAQGVYLSTATTC